VSQAAAALANSYDHVNGLSPFLPVGMAVLALKVAAVYDSAPQTSSAGKAHFMAPSMNYL